MDDDLLPICLYCDHVMGCPLLADREGRLDLDLVITREHFWKCPEWTPIGPVQKATRDRAYAITGIGAVRTLFELPELAANGIKQAEKEMQMLAETTKHFTDMLRQGMLSSERDTQLRYEADDVGNIIRINEEGEDVLRARPDFELKRYASDPDGPIKLSHTQILFWTVDQVIDAIIRKEIELGWLTKDKRPKMPAIVSADTVEPPQVEAPKENVSMPAAAQGKRVRVSTTPNAAARAPGPAAQTQAPAAGPKRIGRPPAQAAPAQPAQAAAPAPTSLPPAVRTAGPSMGPGPGRVARPPAVQPGAAPAQPMQPGQVGAAIGADVGAVVAKVEELAGKVEGIPSYLEGLIKDEIAALRKDLIDALTIQNDNWIQTKGTGQYPATEVVPDGNGGEVEQQVLDENQQPVMNDLPLLWNHPDKILAHAKGTAYDQPGEEAPAGE